MASLYIKDEATAEAVARVARRLGTTKTDAVRRAVAKLESELGEAPRVTGDLVQRMAEWRRVNPLPPPTGPAPDKAFYDWLSGEEDVDGIVR